MQVEAEDDFPVERHYLSCTHNLSQPRPTVKTETGLDRHKKSVIRLRSPEVSRVYIVFLF